MHPCLVQIPAPFSYDDRGHAVADKIGQRPSLRHEAIDAKDQSEPANRDIPDGG